MIKNEEEKYEANISNGQNIISLRSIVNCMISSKEEAPSRPYIKRIIEALNEYEPENKFETIRFITRNEYEKYDSYNIYTVGRYEKTSTEHLDELLMWQVHKNVFPHIKEDLKTVVELSSMHDRLNSAYMTSHIVGEEPFSETHILYDDFWGEGYISYGRLKPYMGFRIYIGDKVYCPKIYGDKRYNIEDIDNFLNIITVNIDDCPKNLREKLSDYSQNQNSNKVKKIGKIK